MQLYEYTILRQDGTTLVLPPCEKKSFEDLYKILKCDTIEIIPTPYYPEGFGDVLVYGDEEARFKETNKRNPHLRVLKGNVSLGEPAEWDVFGDCIKEKEL
jgi:hypothetical protein